MIKTNDSDTVPKNLELVYSGKDYFARLEAIIRDAQFEIHLQMYLFENDANKILIYNNQYQVEFLLI